MEFEQFEYLSQVTGISVSGEGRQSEKLSKT